jgi:hypothetical protein
MLWTYHRDGSQTSYEVNQSADGKHFELTRHHDDGREVVETFEELDQLNARIRQLRDELDAKGWSLAGSGAPHARSSI